jgi:hypothetical protein
LRDIRVHALKSIIIDRSSWRVGGGVSASISVARTLTVDLATALG